MKTLLIPKLSQSGKLTVDRHEIACVNWPQEFPAAPDVVFNMAHTGSSILLEFFVNEKYTQALVTEDNGEVWTDSCVEFFINFDETGYYNLEVNCIGTALLAFRKQKDQATHATQDILDTIIRTPSLGRKPFREVSQGQQWSVAIELPVSAFFMHSIEDLSGLVARGNFYKCGDGLTEPHFLSWNPIHTPSPNFHSEEYFGRLEFE